MYTRRYFWAALTLPLAVVLGGVLVATMLTSIPVLAVGTLVVPYLSFAVVMYVWSLRQPPAAIRRMVYRTPLIFLCFQVSYQVLEYSTGVSLAKDLVGLGGILVIVGIYIVMLGYVYVFIMEQGYLSYLYQKRHRHTTNRSRIRC
ncbi:MAG: hypothetical protein PVG89_09040 [Gammaproteobacteria bacterium]|jgi:hypothetical protein